MKLMRMVAAVSTVVLAGAASSMAFAQQCKQTCNTSYAQCLSSGKADTACLSSWHQCKTGCDAAKVAAYTPVRAQAVVRPAAQAKTVVGKH